MSSLSSFNGTQTNESGMQVAEDTGIDLLHYVKMVRRRKWTIIFSTIIFFTLGLVTLHFSTPIYSATAKIKADPIQPNATSSDQYMMNSMVFLFYETQYEIIQSRKVAENVVEKLDLVSSFKEAQRLAEDEDEDSFIDDFKVWFKEVLDLPAVEKEELTDSDIRTLVADSIRSQLIVDGGTQSQIINITFESPDPNYAAKVVNSVANAYVAFGLQTRLERIEETSEWLSEQLAKLKERLHESEQRLKLFRENSGLVDSTQQQRLASAQLTSLNSELIKAQTRLSQAEELYFQVQKQSGSYESLGPVLESSSVRDLVREESSLANKVNELSERYGEKHPKMIAARSELMAAKLNLSKEISKIVDNIEKEYRLAQTQVKNIQQLIDDTKEQVQSYQGDNFELTRLEREVENNRMIYESFLAKLMETDVSGNYDGSNVSIIDEATVPKYPIKPRIALVLIASILAGVIVGLTTALIRELMTNTFITPDHTEEKLGLPSLGITPLVKRSKNKVVAEKQYISDSRTTFAESINTIRTGIMFSNIGEPPKTILITSTSGSEGKTTLAINLAVAFSQLDKTLLLELDLRKPTVSKKLDLNATKGVTDIITAKASFGDAIVKVDDVSNLDVLTCGTIPTNPMEIIASQKFLSLLERLKETYSYIVIDSPPTLPVSDSCLLAKIVDCSIVAIRAESTKEKMAKEAIHRLNKVGAKINGTVLTQASEQKMSYYGEHYYQDSYYGFEKG